MKINDGNGTSIQVVANLAKGDVRGLYLQTLATNQLLNAQKRQAAKAALVGATENIEKDVKQGQDQNEKVQARIRCR